MNRTIFLAAWIVLLAAASPINARAQSLSISGVVLDQSGATIPGALITLRKGEDTQTEQTGTAGSFSFGGIGPGNYELQAQREGFKPASTRVVVGNRAPRPVQFKLSIADLQQEIVVAGDDQQVSTQTDSNLDVASLDRNALDNAPIFDQNYIATISRFLDSGALGTGGATLYDVRWSRDFKIAPPRNEIAPTISVSFDAFNILNHVNYTSYVGNLSSPFFGKAVSAQPPRRLQVSTRLNF